MPKPTLPHGDMMICAEHRTWVETSLNQLADTDLPEALLESAGPTEENFWSPEYAWARPYRVQDRALIVPVKGVLLHSFPYSFGGFATGYDYIEAAVRRGAADPDVDRIILHVNSPGGLVAGCFDAVDAIYEARGSKPIISVADENALSAAYAIASAADEIVVPRTGSVGSVGVITAYTDMSRALENAGITVNLVFAGDRKADAHPSQPLSDEARARIQERVNNSYEIFVSTVARNRGLEERAVRDTEADFFTAQEAVQNGLADRVGSLGTLSANAENSPEQEDDTMSDSNDTPAVAQAAHEAAVQAATDAGLAEGARAERTRIATIMDSDEAKARPAAARQVALHSDMSAEAAATFLAGLPEEPKAEGRAAAPKAGASAFEQAMAGTQNPNLGADGGQVTGDDETDDDVVSGIFASAGYRAAS